MSNTRPTLEERVIERWGNFENITGSSYVAFHVRAELEALRERMNKAGCVIFGKSIEWQDGANRAVQEFRDRLNKEIDEQLK